jgi:glycosyltransferase involved in cell wall biosynthesis
VKILWIPHTSWRIPQRAHLFCRALAGRHAVHVTDWDAGFASLRDYLSARYLRNFTYRQHRDGEVIVHGIPRLSPALYFPALRRLNAAVFSWYVQRIIARFNIDVVVGTFVVPPPRAPRLIFDLFDENVAYWRSFGPVPAYAAEIERTELAYLQSADAVVAASSVLADKAGLLGARGPVHLIPNGVDLRQYAHADGAAFRQRLGVAGKLVGSVANHDKLAELEKILAAAQMLSAEQVTFLIAGRGSAVPLAQRKASRLGLSNILFQGFIPPDQVADLISALDVGLCAYARSPMDDARSPMRLLLYSAAGLPTVCTDLEEVRRMNFPNVVLVQDDPASLAAGVRSALQMPRTMPGQISDYDLPVLVERWEGVLCSR